MKKLLLPLIPLGGVALFFVGAALGDATHDDPTPVLARTTTVAAPTPVADPTVAPTAALARPAAYERIDGASPPADAAPKAPADLTTQPPSAPISAPGVDSGSASASSSSSSSSASSTTATTTPLSTDALVAFGIAPDPDLAPLFRYIDPCSQPDAPHDACGDGVGATVLALMETTPPDPLAFDNGLHAVPIPTSLARCPVNGTTPDGHVRITFMTNNPAHLDLHIAGHDSSIDASDSERDRWTDHRLAGDASATRGPNAVQYCLDFTGLTPGSSYDLTINGRDDFGSTRSATYPLVVPAVSGTTGNGRPPTTFSPQGDDHGVITASLAEGEQLWYAELPRNTTDRTDATCTDVEAQVIAGHYPGSYRLFNGALAPLAGLFAADYPYDQRYQYASSIQWWPDEGESASICTWITKPAARSFDAPLVQDRTELDLEAPRYHRYRVSLYDAHFDRAPAAGSVHVLIEEGAFNSGSVEVPNPLTAPIAVGDSAGHSHADTATLDVTSEFGTLTTVLNVPRLGSSPGIQLIDVPVKGPRAGSGLCGSSFGSCDPPTSETILGTLRLSVIEYDGPGGAAHDRPGWTTWEGSSAAFDAAPSSGLAPHAQIDTNGFSLTARGGAGARPTLLAQFTTDRPVVATVHTYGWTDGAACGGEPQTDTAPTLVHDFHWSNVCFGSGYQLVIALTDDAGTVSTWDVGGNSGPPLGYVVTPGLPATSLTIATSFTSHVPLAPLGTTITVDGITAGPPTGGSGPDRRCQTYTGAPADVAHGIRFNNEGGYPITLNEPVYVHVSIDVGTDDGAGECYRDSRHQFEGYVSLADLVSGTPVTFTGDDATLSITIAITAVVPAPITPSS